MAAPSHRTSSTEQSDDQTEDINLEVCKSEANSDNSDNKSTTNFASDKEVNHENDTAIKFSSIRLEDDKHSISSERAPSSSDDNERKEKENSSELTTPRHSKSEYFLVRLKKNENRNSGENYDPSSDKNKWTPIKKLRKLSMRKSFRRQQSFKTDEKIKQMIQELINTEEVYISGLHIILEKYWPFFKVHASTEFNQKIVLLFGILGDIRKEAHEFLIFLKEHQKNADDFIRLFLESSALFGLYLHYFNYFKNFKSTEEHDVDIIKEASQKLNDKLGLVSHLMTPMKRLETYLFMLEYIKDILQKSNKPVDNINSAMQVIHKVMKHDASSPDYIRKSKIDLKKQGSLIRKDEFKILKPKKVTSVVFVFEKAVIFTTQTEKSLERFDYIGSIRVDNLSILRCEDSPFFQLVGYTDEEWKTNEGACIYTLKPKTISIKEEWIKQIEDMLWNEQQKAKQEK